MIELKSSSRRLWFWLPLILAFTAAQVKLGSWGLRVFPPQCQPLLRAVFGYAPFGLAGVVLLGVALALYRFTGQTFRFAPRGLEVTHHGRELCFPWAQTFVSRSRNQAVIGDGLSWIRVDRFFFAELDRLCDMAETAHRMERLV